MTRFCELCLRHPAATLAATLLASLALGTGGLRLESEAGYRAFLGSAHPVLRDLDALSARFGGALPFAAVWDCGEATACDSVFDASSLGMAHHLARRLEREPGVSRVDGPATSPLLTPVDLGLPEVRRLAPEGVPAADIEALAAHALADPSWVGQLVSRDGRAGALLVHLSDSTASTGERVLAVLRESLVPFEARGHRFQLVGGPVEFVVAGAELAHEAARVVPLMVAIVAVILTVLFRATAPALASLACVGLAVAWALGLQGWLAWPQNSLSQALPPLVLVIGVCDAMHLVAGYATRLARAPTDERADRQAAMLAVVAEIGSPCLMTTLTTAASFASFALSGLESMERIGWIAAFGVCAALVLSFSLLPVLLVRLPARRVASVRSALRWRRVLDRVLSLSQRRAGSVLLVSLVLAGLGGVGFTRLRIDARFEDIYGEDSQVVRWARAAARLLREPETLEIAIQPAPGVAAHDPALLRVVAQAEQLADLDGLGPALSILAPMRQLHQLVHHAPLVLDGGARSAERARRMLRLLRFEDPELVSFFVDAETGAHRISIQSAKLAQEDLRALLAEVRRRLDATLPSGWKARVTGPLAVVAALVDEIRRTQLHSFALAAALVWVLMVLHFRSPWLASIGLLPTALPVLLTLGAMGFAGLALDVGSAMVAAVVLGLAVDDAIHLIDAWRRRRAAGESAQAAVASALHEVGRALATTSFALATGFLALSLAPWQSIASFGFVAAVAILAALVAVLLVLPALLAWRPLAAR